MYSNIANLKISIRNINVEYLDGSKFEFVSDIDMMFPKEKEYSVTGTLNGVAGQLEIKHGNLVLTAMPRYAASFYFPSEVIYNVNKFIKRGKEFDLNYCKHLRNTFSKLHFVEVCLNNKTFDDETVNMKIEKLRNLTMMYSTGVYTRPTLVYYVRSEKPVEILYSIVKEGKIVEQNEIQGYSLAVVPMYEP